MRLGHVIGTAAILAVYEGGSSLLADETDDAVKALKQQNELLQQKVKGLEEQLNQRFNTLQEQLDQKVKVVDRKHELDNEAKLKEKGPLFIVTDWVTGIILVNDFRIRYDQTSAPESDFVTRSRIRSRLRLGAIATLKDDWEIGLRLTTAPSIGRDSGGDPLSTQATFEDNGSRKAIGLDWAFARWTPIHMANLTGSIALGKLENPPNYSENVFDVDYTPEGLAEQFAFKINADHTLSTYFGQYYLDELQFSGKDPYLFLEQLRLESNWGKHL